MNDKKSRDIALALLRALSADDIDSVMAEDSAFNEDDNWRPYGNSPKNWDRVNNQTSDPVGAFGELLINSIDAILMKKSQEENWDARDKSMPRSMTEAVKKLYPEVVEGKIGLLSAGQRSKLAEQSVLVGIKRAKGLKKHPTYTIADFGEGQNADAFPRTLVSLGEKNKEGIPFVQGRFNMGSTGSIIFCTQSDILRGHYKFILSKRNLPDSDGNWGWTLIRTRKVREGEELPVVEYFCPGGKIPRFKKEFIEAFNHADIGVINGGTVVKLYEYDIGPSNRAVDFGLDQALTTNLLECALPIRIYDFNAKPQPGKGTLRPQGIADRTFSGMRIAMEDGKDKASDGDLPRYEVMQGNQGNSSLGKIKIYATGVAKLSEHMQGYPFRCFYTVNGQTQAKEYAGFYRRAKLDDLRNHVIVQVDCNGMDGTARSSIFKSNRQHMNENRVSRELRQIVVDALRDDSALRDYARQIRQRRITEAIEQDERGGELWDVLLKGNPELKELLGMGGAIVASKPSEGGAGDADFEGKQFPTYLELVKPGGALNLPVNSWRNIECKTDAENQYFGRLVDPGEFFWTSESELPYSMRLRNGRLKITVYPPSNARVGESVVVSFGFKDSNPARVNALSHKIEVVFCSPEEKTAKKSGTSNVSRKSGETENALSPPFIHYKGKAEWPEFDDDSGAQCLPGEEMFEIIVNKDNKHLRTLVQEEREETGQSWVRHTFMMAVGVMTLAIYKRFEKQLPEDSNRDLAVKEASAAISSYVVRLIRKLGGRQ